MLDLSGVKPIKGEPYPFTELQEKCIRDLETTEAPQAPGYLEYLGTAHRKEGFCCLGRFCVVAGATRTVSAVCASFTFGDGDDGEGRVSTLPDSLATLLRLKDDMGEFSQNVDIQGKGEFSNLADMNDSGKMSFKEIAQYIRHDPWNVFDAPVAAETTEAGSA